MHSTGNECEHLDGGMRGENCYVDATALARHALVVNQAAGFGIDGYAHVVLGMKNLRGKTKQHLLISQSRTMFTSRLPEILSFYLWKQ
jgi:hypothetical protein